MLTFNSPGAFARHLRRLQATQRVADEGALKLAGGMIRDETKAMLGHYQTALTGPFAAWAPLLRSGILRDSIEMSSDDKRANIGVPDREVQYSYARHPVNIGEVAEDLESGTKYMPPLSFLGMTMFGFGEAAAALIGSVEAAWLAGLPLPTRRRRPAE